MQKGIYLNVLVSRFFRGCKNAECAAIQKPARVNEKLLRLVIIECQTDVFLVLRSRAARVFFPTYQVKKIKYEVPSITKKSFLYFLKNTTRNRFDNVHTKACQNMPIFLLCKPWRPCLCRSSLLVNISRQGPKNVEICQFRTQAHTILA
jgi:hypothetical protein